MKIGFIFSQSLVVIVALVIGIFAEANSFKYLGNIEKQSGSSSYAEIYFSDRASGQVYVTNSRNTERYPLSEVTLRGYERVIGVFSAVKQEESEVSYLVIIDDLNGEFYLWKINLESKKYAKLPVPTFKVGDTEHVLKAFPPKSSDIFDISLVVENHRKEVILIEKDRRRVGAKSFMKKTPMNLSADEVLKLKDIKNSCEAAL